MKCEIVNPSDCCFISCGNREALALACVLLGNGQYALKEVEKGELICPIMLFGNGPKWWEDTFKRTIDQSLDALESETAEVLESFEYPQNGQA